MLNTFLELDSFRLFYLIRIIHRHVDLMLQSFQNVCTHFNTIVDVCKTYIKINHD